jgi:hypothetical protein
METVKENKIEKISRTQLEHFFVNFKKVAWTGCAFSNITYLVDEKNSPQKNGVKLLKKIVNCNITIGSDYELKVNRILINKQGVEPSENGSGKVFSSSDNWFTNAFEDFSVPLVKNKKATDNSKLYLCYISEHHTVPLVKYFKNGSEEISKEDAIQRGLLRVVAEKTAGRGSVSEENNFFFRVLALDSIISFTINHVVYHIVD